MTSSWLKLSCSRSGMTVEPVDGGAPPLRARERVGC
jgi:hypothetical protein